MSVIGEAMEEKIYELNKQIKQLQQENEQLRREKLDWALEVSYLKEQNKLLENQLNDMHNILISAENDRIRPIIARGATKSTGTFFKGVTHPMDEEDMGF